MAEIRRAPAFGPIHTVRRDGLSLDDIILGGNSSAQNKARRSPDRKLDIPIRNLASGSMQMFSKRLALRVFEERWPMRAPFRITGKTFTHVDLIRAEVERNGLVGQGEAPGVYYADETPAHMIAQLAEARGAFEQGADRHDLLGLLPAGGARNALDAALWELEAAEAGQSVATLAGLAPLRPLQTVLTLGAATPSEMAKTAKALAHWGRLKLKLTGEPEDADRVRAVRAATPDGWLAVDANQGFTPSTLDQLTPVLIAAGVKLIEQPFPVGSESWLEGWEHVIPIAGDESLLDLPDIESMPGRFECLNIKLDKCGGLTRALAMVKRARELGLSVMVGNMSGTSLSMAPAFILGQLCDVVDLDGPLVLSGDRSPSVEYQGGFISLPRDIWGGCASSPVY